MQSIVVGIGLLIFILVSGFIYIKLGMLKAETASIFLENPQQVEMYHQLQRIEKKLDTVLPKEESAETKEFKEFFE